MPSSQLTRRDVLTGGGLFLTATLGGCSQLPSSDSGASSRRLALSVSPLDGPLRDRYVVDLTETRPPWDEAAFDAAVNGSAYTTQYHTPFFARDDDHPTYAERDGTYYRLDSLLVGEETVTHPVLRLYTVGRLDGLDDVPEYVPHSELPEVDQRAVEIAHFAARARGNTGGVPWDLVERGGYVYRDEGAIAASELLDDSGVAHVEHRETIYEVAVAREPFHEPVYRAAVDPVADSESEIERILQAALLDARLTREQLSSGERDILIRAIDDSYGESYPYSEAYESLLKKLDYWAYIDGDIENDAIESKLQRRHLRYDDRYFSYTLRFVEMDS